MKSNIEATDEQGDWRYQLGLVGALMLLLLVVSSPLVLVSPNKAPESQGLSLEDQVIPVDGVVLPISWGALGARMAQAGVIDETKFLAVYKSRGGLSEVGKSLLEGTDSGTIRITRRNSGELLNLLWAFGLANKNEILEKGPMVDGKYGGDPGRFASTGGWSLAVGDPMDHYSKHAFVTLTDEQQARVETAARGIYRPCCGNSTHFPDCNHGIAMLGLLELLAAEGLSEEEMFDTALAVNSYWFPETYMTLAAYFEQEGRAWKDVDPRIALGNDYSSASGYRRVLQAVNPVESAGGGGCSV